MPIRNFFAICLTLFLVSCASTHPGDMGKAVNQKDKLNMKLSARNIGKTSGSAFQTVEVTIENTSSKWLRIDSAKAVFSKNEDELSVVVGKDLKFWAEAKMFEKKKKQHNKGMAMMALLGAGAAAMGTGAVTENEGLVAAGGAAVIGTEIWALSDTINLMQEEAQGISDKNPSNHLYNSFSVPGEMSLRRWILFNKPADEVINKLVLKFKTVEGEVAHYAVNI